MAKELKERSPQAIEAVKEKYSEEIGFTSFSNICFTDSGKNSKHMQNQKGIQIIGDIPILCGF